MKSSFLHFGSVWMATYLLRSSAAFVVRRQLLHSNLHFWSTTNAARRISVSAAVDNLAGKKLVSVRESIQVHGEPGVVFVDGSWFLKDRNSREEFEAGPRIPGARFFDIDDIAAKGDLNKKDLPHMMPPKNLFAAAMDAMGITNDDHLIVYSSKDCMLVHRAWYQIQAMGHDRDLVHLMDGSIEDWQNEGGPIDTRPTKIISAADLDLSKEPKYKATDAQNVVDMEEVKNIIEQGDKADAIIVDARSEDRFYGRVEEPRPGLRLGHMPGAKNLFFATLLDEENPAKLKPKEELEKRIADAGIDPHTDKRIVASCGSGASACVIATALDICGRDPKKTFIYDGSWSEWGADKDTQITKDGDHKRKRED